MQLLKLSTSASLVVGPVLDSTGAEYASAVIGDISLSKNGGTLTALASLATLTYVANGHYTLALIAGNTDTLGRADLFCNKAGYQMPPVRLTVLAATPFDTLVTNGTLASTTSGRTLDVSAGGEAGIDWANVGSPTTTVALSGTTVGTVTTYTGDTPQTGDAYAQTNSGTFGLAAIKGYVDDIGVAGAGLTALGDTRIANLDAVVSSRMATYTQPTGFLAATFPTTLASTTNITAGTITTVTTTTTATNLTNAPTVGDFTSAMKTSLNAATPASVTGAVGSVVGAVGSVTGAVGSVTGNVGGMTASGWATAFTTDTTKAFADAVEGSVVKEIADGVASGGGTVDANLVSVNGTTFAGANVPSVLADGVVHGGTTAKLRLGSSSSTPALYVTNTGGHAVALDANGAAALMITAEGTGTQGAVHVEGTGSSHGLVVLASQDVAASGSALVLDASGGAGLLVNTGGSNYGVEISGGSVGLSVTGGNGPDVLLAGSRNFDFRLVPETLAQLFTLNSTKVYADAVAGSVVKEVATNAGGGTLATASALSTVAGYIDTEVAAIKAKTDNLPSSPAAVGSAMSLANGAITEASISQPGEAAGRPTGFLAKVQRLFEWASNKRTRNKTTGVVTLRDEADASTLESQTQSTVEPVDTQSKGV